MSQLTKEIIELIQDFKVSDEGIIETSYSFPDGFIGFSGHFPNDPILPGICIMKAAMLNVMVYLKKKLRLKEMETIKFFSPVRPNEELSFRSEIIPAENDDSFLLNTKVTCGNRKIALMKLEVITAL